jgi:membrane associated rhomboid family serine protease
MNSILDDFKLAFRSGNILYQIIVINVVVFVALLIANIFLFFAEQDTAWLLVQSFFEFDPRPEKFVYRPWTILTYGFTHYGIFHILFNMLVLYWFGKIITDLLGQNKLLGLYVWGVISGALLYFILYFLFPRAVLLGGNNPEMIGASAGVFAVMVGAATFQPDLSFRLLLIGEVKIKYIAAFYILLSLTGVTGDNSGGEIAHLGGALIGYISMTQLKNGNDWSRPVVKFILWVKSFFVSQPKIKVSYKNEQRFGSSASTKTKRTSSRSSRSSKSKEPSQEEIDAILDKISEKGYDALSKEEKQKLFNAGNQ